MTELRPELPELTTRLAALPVDERGYPVPWFVASVDGQPDHRVMEGKKIMVAWLNKLCWICGQPLGGATVTFAIGPMCAVNRVSAEPPSHFECCEWSVRGCPFLSRPHAHRREHDYPEGAVEPAGIMLKRNPGVMLLWTAKRHTVASIMDPNGGTLFRVGEPSSVSWWCQGREATRDEVMESLNSGLPTLVEMAHEQGDDAVRALGGMVVEAMELVPA